jgi:integrase
LNTRTSASDRALPKGGRPRTVLLWWDADTLADTAAWYGERTKQAAPPDAPLLDSRRPGREPRPLSRHTLRKRFRTACKVLGPERLRTLTIHHGRHTFLSHALAGGRTLAEVRNASGHSSVTIAARRLHSLKRRAGA